MNKRQSPQVNKNSPARRVLLGLSGGVDSAASAVLLKARGYELVAVTLRTWEEEEGDGARWERAARSAGLLGLTHRILDVRQAFFDQVVQPFVAAWRQGQTPNPCVLCNPEFKFRIMAELADELGCSYLATGHYARTEVDEAGNWLYRARHRSQDQSYFLYRLPPEILDRVLFPLADKSKEEARRIASSAGDPAAETGDSQDICFIGKGQLKQFLGRQGLEDKPGHFVNSQGELIGEHRGSWRYTVGQRRHLGQSFGRRMTVLALDGEKNLVVLGDEEEAFIQEMTLVDLFSPHPLPPSFPAGVQLRSQGKPLPAQIRIDREAARAWIHFESPVRLSSPGQSAVFYDQDRVLGGGIVEGMS